MDRMNNQWPMKKLVDIIIIFGHHIKRNHIYITKNPYQLQPVSPINDPEMNIKCQVKPRKLNDIFFKYNNKNKNLWNENWDICNLVLARSESLCAQATFFFEMKKVFESRRKLCVKSQSIKALNFPNRI